jgi:hypothetical protein
VNVLGQEDKYDVRWHQFRIALKKLNPDVLLLMFLAAVPWLENFWEEKAAARFLSVCHCRL